MAEGEHSGPGLGGFSAELREGLARAAAAGQPLESSAPPAPRVRRVPRRAATRAVGSDARNQALRLLDGSGTAAGVAAVRTASEGTDRDPPRGPAAPQVQTSLQKPALSRPSSWGIWSPGDGPRATLQTGGVVELGRSSASASASTVVIADERVSRRHASVLLDGGRLIVRDLGSANGTWLFRNGEHLPVDEAGREAEDGDVIMTTEGVVLGTIRREPEAP